MTNASKHDKGKEISEHVETNDLGQVKIASSAKYGKWTRKKGSKKKSTRALHKKHSNKSPLQARGNKKSREKVIDDSALYSLTSTPLTWSTDLYVKELLNAKQRLEVLEVKEQERDLKIHIITTENKALVESNTVLKEQVLWLQQALLIGKTEWQHMKADVQNIKKSVVESTEVTNAKSSQDKGKAIAQIDNHEEKAREERKGDSTKVSKTYAQVISNSANKEEETNIQVDNMQDREGKEKQNRTANIIIKGVKDYGKNECTFDLARDFLKDKLLWQEHICQAWGVGKFNGERVRPIKVIMPSLDDKYIILTKKHLLKGSRFFLEEDLTVKQQKERREKMLKVRVARDEGKRAWIYKGKVVIARFGPPSKTEQQDGNKEEATNS
eukprot:PITA_32593